MNIYVVNLSPGTRDEDLKELFTPYGTVAFVRVIMDKFTGASKGHGFVEMPDEEALAAIAALDGATLLGNKIRVMEARPVELRTGSPSPRQNA